MARRSRNEEAAMDSYFYARVRGEIVGTYAQAESDLAEKLRRFTALFEAQDKEKRAQLSAGTITKAEYDSWLRGQVFRGERWKAVRQECVDQIHRANETTARMLNGERRALFQKAANYSAYQIEQGTRGAVNFTLYDSATVTRLIQKRPKLLPDLKVGKRRDESWNGRGIQNAITQGIIQGESIPDIAKRIAHQTGERNRAALTRQARTAMTGAQNAGRVQAMWEAEDEGIKIQKKWIATLDRKTRDAHAELDGQIVDADQPFIVDGMEIMYPGDPNADPSLVYNCRCTLGWVYPDHPSAPGARRDNETGEVIGGVSYAEWEQGKTEPTPPAAEPTIAGVTRGKPMAHADADSGRVNPHYGEGREYNINCQSCVVAYEARRRGYDLEVVPRDSAHPKCEELARDSRLAWFDKDGNRPRFLIAGAGRDTEKKAWYHERVWQGEKPTAKRFSKILHESLEPDARYTLEFSWTDGHTHGSHIVTLRRDGDDLVIYDPQSNRQYRGDRAEEYIGAFQYKRQYMGSTYYQWPGVMRVDDKVIDFDTADGVTQGRKP